MKQEKVTQGMVNEIIRIKSIKIRWMKVLF